MLLVAALVVASSLHSSFWYQWNTLVSEGIDKHIIVHTLLFNAESIGVCVSVAVFAAYYLIYSCLNQLSPTVRELIAKRNRQFVLGNAFVVGAILFIGGELMQIVPYLYPTELSSVPISYFTPFVVGAVSVLVVGISLMVKGYLKAGELQISNPVLDSGNKV